MAMAAGQSNQPISWLSPCGGSRIGGATVGSAAVEQIAQVEMGVTASAGVHVDMNQLRNTRCIEGPEEPHVEAGLLDALTPGRLPRRLARIDVPSRLHPEPEPLVLQQHDPARPDHEARPRHVDRIVLPGERIVECVEGDQEGVDRGRLAVVHRHPRRHGGPHDAAQSVGWHGGFGHAIGVAGAMEMTAL